MGTVAAYLAPFRPLGAAPPAKPTVPKVRGLHPVAQADQARASRGIGAADAVVADREVQVGVALFDGDVRV
jgi:hypothetical protein